MQFSVNTVTKGWCQCHHPEYIISPYFTPFIGVYTEFGIHPKFTFLTPCGLLLKGDHIISDMGYMGVNWMVENDNAVINCPYYSLRDCPVRHPLLRGKNLYSFISRIGNYKHCSVCRTELPWEYSNSLEKVLDDNEAEEEKLWKAFAERHKGRVCKHQAYFNRSEKKWHICYNPMRCADFCCSYCSVLGKPISSKKANVYDTSPELLKLFNLCCLRCGRPMPQNLSESSLSRYADVYICPDCGTDEAMRDYAKKPISLRDWYATISMCIKQELQFGSAYLIDICEFPSVFKETKAIPLSSTRHPVSEVVYSRSDYDGTKWWTTWQDCQETRVKKELAQEIDAFHSALFDMPEMKNLASMTELKKYAEPTEDANEFNLYSETEHFYIWLRFILREKDYNLYCHYYLK